MIYDFHGFAKIRIESAPRSYYRYFENEYRRINALSSGKPAGETSISIHVVDRLPEPIQGDLCRSPLLKKLFRFHYLIRGFDTHDVHIYFRRHPIDRIYTTAVGVFLQGQVLEPVLYGKLLEQGVLLMHAAGVADGKYAYLFPAHGGTGKTTLSLRLARLRYELLGDDLVLVDPKAALAYPFPRPLHLFWYNVRQMRDVGLPWRLRAVIRFKDILRFFLELVVREEFLISTRAHIDEILPDIKFGTVSPYRRIIFLSMSRTPEDVDLSETSVRDEMALVILASADLNQSLYYDVLGEEYPELDELKQQELAVVGSVLSNVSSISFLNPRELTDSDFERLANELRT